MSDRGLAVIGIPLYNQTRHLCEAVETLLTQTYGDLRLVLVDDGASEEVERVCLEYARRDPRVVYRRNPERLGYIRNANRCFAVARELFPEARYFAWGSDHDAWHPRWLECMVEALEEDRGAVLAYPLNFYIGDEGEVLKGTVWSFETRGEADPVRRLKASLWDMAAGCMVYGVYRVEPLLAAGGLSEVLLPDRLLLCELALEGRFLQVKEFLWYRRYKNLFSLSRQVNASFPGARPWSVYLPWWITHAATLTAKLKRGSLAHGAGLGACRVGILYGVHSVVREAYGLTRKAWSRATAPLRQLPGWGRARILPIWRRAAMRFAAATGGARA